MRTADSPQQVRIVAITPVHNRRELTLDCLQSLFASDLSGIDLHVIVVDDGSSDGTAAAIRSDFPQLELVQGDGSLFYAAGMNAGFEAALPHDPEYVLGFNDDSRFPPDCLRLLLRCAEDHHGSIVGPLLLDWDQPESIFQIAPEFSISYGGWKHWTRQAISTVPKSPFRVSSIAGNCVLIPAEALRSNQWMRAERLQHYGDTELTVRLRRAGWTLLIEPRARLLCQPNTPPRRLRTMPLRKMAATLLFDPSTPHNLRHRFWHTYWTAPSRAEGLLAFGVHIARLALRAAGIERSWPDGGDETPLALRVPSVESRAIDEAEDATVVWYVWPYPEWGGVQIYLIHVATVARTHGYEVRALIPEHAAPELKQMLLGRGIHFETFAAVWDGSETSSIPHRIQRRLRQSRVHRAIVQRLRELTINDTRRVVVHADLAPWSTVAPLLDLLKFAGVVTTIHTPLPRVRPLRSIRWRNSLRRLFHSPRFACTAQSGAAKRSLAPYLPARFLETVRISPGMVDREELNEIVASPLARVEVEEWLGLGRCELRLGAIGQLIERKGYRVLVEAIEWITREGIDVQVLWCGPGQRTADIEDAIARAGGRFVWRDPAALGHEPRAALRVLHAAADLYVLPSSQEGFPIALAEAMALGMPCIAARTGAIPEMLHHGRNGLLVTPSDPGALAGAVIQLWRDLELRERIGRAAREQALRFLEKHHAALPTLEAYRDAAGITR